MWRHALSFLLLFTLSLAGLAQAADQPAAPTLSPLPRLETGMHTAPINRIATDAAGRWAVTASDDKTARVWDVASRRLLQVLRPPQDVGDEGKLYAVAMSPDGATVAVGGWTGWDWHGTATIYLFDRASGQLHRRIAGLPNVILHLAWSPDGRWLAASLGGRNGVRVFDAASGHETDRDPDYGGASYSVQFSPLSTTAPLRLLTTCEDGQVRLYRVDQQGRLSPPKTARPSGGKDPYAARFSPDGQRIALGYFDSTTVQVLEADTLAASTVPPYVQLNLSGVDNGDLFSVAWTRDGRLLAAGRWDVAGKATARMWDLAAGGGYRDLPLANRTIMDLVPLADGGLLFAATDPAWGVLDGAGEILRRQDGDLADLRGQREFLGVSADGRRVRFRYKYGGKDPKVFDLAHRALVADDPSLPAPRTRAEGIEVENWEDRPDPRLNGQPLTLRPYETARSLAVAADGRDFILGAEWRLRRYDRAGGLVWEKTVPGAVWAVNLSADGRFVVAAYADGTIRWHRFSDGQEILALFPHADQQRWIAWTPEGFYASSGPEADELFGYHLNHGPDQAGEFVPAARLREAFFQPDLIAHRLDEDGDQRLAERVKQRGDIRALLAAAPLPELELLSREDDTCSGTCPLRFRIKQAGQGEGRLLVKVDGQEFKPRWSAPPLTSGGVVELPLDLADGLRRISLELLDGRGIASKPLLPQRQVKHASPAAAPRLHVLAVGVSAYRDRSLTQGVAYAAADAKAVAAAVGKGGARVYGAGRVRVLADARRADILAAGQEMAADIQEQDVFILYLAGHGRNEGGDYVFLPQETRLNNRAAVLRDGLHAGQLRDLLAGVKAKKVLVLLDTCSAGTFSLSGQKPLASRAGPEEKAALDRLQRLSGRALLAATADEKMALEGEGGHGVFTYALLQGLTGTADRNKDGLVDVRELADHLDEHVPAITQRKWGYEQFPWLETLGSTFPVVRK